MHSVLVIEDDHDTRVSIRKILEEEGYYVFSAANGADGLTTLQRIKPPCVIILDQNMPLMNADAFLAAKNCEPSFTSIPVIVLSAFVDRSTVLGASEFIPKPFNLDTLLERVQKYCKAA